ncbi:hypothetical protein BJX70DRAFT_150504 [Aspergillus crustosus]
MGDSTVLRKDQLEVSLHNEQKLIKEGTIIDDNPLDLSEPFRQLCDACRKGDLKVCQEKITEGVNINARDSYDYTPLILASLCGHYEVARLLLGSGALCERDTFQGERCLYNALNDRIRNLLLEYNHSKSTDPLQPLAAHTASLLVREQPKTSDIEVAAGDEILHLHKFILAARSPYFRQKLNASPETITWKLPSTIPPQAFATAIKYLYLGEPPRDIRSGPGTGFTESEVFAGIDKIAKHLQISSLVDSILASGDRRIARQRRTTEIARGRDQLEEWFRENVLGSKIVLDTTKGSDITWDHNNSVFADVFLQADELPEDVDPEFNGDANSTGLPIGPIEFSDSTPPLAKSTLFPCHRAMLLRSDFFQTMFNSPFREAHMKKHLHIIPVDCSPEVLEIILTFLYTERADFSLDVAVEVLFAADMLFIEKLKTKAAVVISTLGSGSISQAEAAKTRGNLEDDIDIYSIIRAAWLTRVQHLEDFAARFLAYRLEAHIDLPEFAELIQESASRIQKRQETDSIELLDDIRFYLDERFRLRFDDAGIEEMLEEAAQQQVVDTIASDQDIEKFITGTEAIDLVPKDSAHVNGDGPPQPPSLSERDRGPVIRTLNGEIVEDESTRDAANYEILMDKLNQILESLSLDA